MKFFDRIKLGWQEISEGTSGEQALLKQSKAARFHEIEQAVIVLSAAVLRPGGNFSSVHEELLVAFLNHHFGQRHTSKRTEAFRDHYKMGPQPFVKMACEAIKSLAANEARQEILFLLVDLAAAEQFIGESQIRLIKKISGYLQTEEQQWREVQHRMKQWSPFAMLEMEETTSLAAIKGAYRKMVLKYHPDKSKQHEREAARHFRDIQRAYETLLAQIGSR
ncbi:MAG: J domain-containing protein [Chitinophagales bacterium]